MTGSLEQIRAALEQDRVLDGRTDAEAHVGVVCFKLGPPELIGAELEWLVGRPADPRHRPSALELAHALGPYAPTSISPSSPCLPLPEGSIVSVEPGGQLEISSIPFRNISDLARALVRDSATIRAMLVRAGLDLVEDATDRRRPPHRILSTHRYRAMESAFDAIGPFGRLMMTNTAALQISVDAGADRAELAHRWATLHDIGPALIAAFSRSPDLHSAPSGRWASQRMRTWLHLDPARTQPIGVGAADPVGAYAHWAVAAPLLCVRREDGPWTAPRMATFGHWVDGELDTVIGRRPTTGDLDYHLTTLFPPVRPKGFLEVRYLDAQPGDGWRVPLTVLTTLLGSSAVAEAARVAVRRTAGHWSVAASCGLAYAPMRQSAVALLDLATEHLDDPAAAAALADSRSRIADGLPAIAKERP